LILKFRVLSTSQYILKNKKYGKNMNSQQYESLIEGLKSKYNDKENIIKTFIEESFQPSEITYDRFMGVVENCNEVFYREVDLILNIINLDSEITKKSEEEIKNRLNMLKSLVDKIEELALELVISSSSSYEKSSEELGNLLSDMQNLILSVRDYEIKKPNVSKIKSKNTTDKKQEKEKIETRSPEEILKYRQVDELLKEEEILRLVQISYFKFDDHNEPNTALLTDEEILKYARNSHTASRIRLRNGIGDNSDKIKIHGYTVLGVWVFWGFFVGMFFIILGGTIFGILGAIIGLLLTVGVSTFVTIYLLVLKNYEETS